MKKVLIFLGFILCIGIGVGAGFFLWHKDEKHGGDVLVDPEYAVDIENVELTTMEKVANLAFNGKKDKLNVNDLSNQEKIGITIGLMDKSYEDTTGTEITEAFYKYFGKNQEIELVDILYDENMNDLTKSNMNIIYKFDKDQDKYTQNPDFPGYGGTVDLFNHYMKVDSIRKTTGGTILYRVKVIYYHMWGDTKKAGYYKSYQDGLDGNNPLKQIDNIDNYIPSAPNMLQKEFDEYHDKLDTYTFKFKQQGNDLVFRDYTKE